MNIENGPSGHFRHSCANFKRRGAGPATILLQEVLRRVLSTDPRGRTLTMEDAHRSCAHILTEIQSQEILARDPASYAESQSSCTNPPEDTLRLSRKGFSQVVWRRKTAKILSQEVEVLLRYPERSSQRNLALVLRRDPLNRYCAGPAHAAAVEDALYTVPEERTCPETRSELAKTSFQEIPSADPAKILLKRPCPRLTEIA